MAMFPCQKASFLGIFPTLLYGDGHIRADVLALAAANAVVHADGLALGLPVKLENLFRADRDTETTALAPGLVNTDIKLLSQPIHPPPSKTSQESANAESLCTDYDIPQNDKQP
jgi:hypothetical protein